MAKYLIITGDDFGFSKGINQAHIQGHLNGILTDHAIMMNCSYTQDAYKQAKENQIDTIGIHICMMNMNKGDRYLKTEDYDHILDTWSIKKITRKIDFEIKSFEDLFGLRPTFINGHQNLHLHPKVADFIISYCRPYKIPIRRNIDTHDGHGLYSFDLITQINLFLENEISLPDYFLKHIDLNIDFTLVYNKFLKELENIPENSTTEILLHPGYVNDELKKVSSMTKERERDLKLAKDMKFQEKIRELRFTLTSFKNRFSPIIKIS